jgi:hypothetical protein
MLNHDEQVWDEPCQLMVQWDDKVVPVLLVHGLQDVQELLHDGRMVEESPV